MLQPVLYTISLIFGCLFAGLGAELFYETCAKDDGVLDVKACQDHRFWMFIVSLLFLLVAVALSVLPVWALTLMELTPHISHGLRSLIGWGVAVPLLVAWGLSIVRILQTFYDVI
jgi:hypothetical protein